MLPNIQIIYASTSGNVEVVCKKIAEVLNANRIQFNLLKAEETDISTLQTNRFFVLATSTWEHGRINPYFDDLFAEIKQADLSERYAAFVGLGDTRYEPVYFCKGMDDLKEAFIESNGRKLGTALKINGEPRDQMDIVQDWAKQLVLNIKRYAR